MAKSNTIQFKGTFDGSQILNELKKVRASMSEAGASDTLFKNVDKDILATEKLVNDMMAQIQKGFSNTKEISAFEKQISKLQANFLKISTGLKGANLSENFTFNSPEIAKLIQEINRLIAAQDRLKESSKNALAAAGRNLDFNQKDVKEIQKAVDANEDLEEALIRVAKAKEKAAKANAGRAGLGTDEGRKYIKNANAGLSLDDLGATAMSGKTAKSVDDARARGAGGKLKRGSKGLRLDPDKAIAAVNETYQQALEETIANGGNAVEAVEAMKKAIADYGVELKQVEQLQENFAKDIENFYSGDIIGTGQKSAVTKAQKAGKTNAQGQFELSDDAKRQVVNNSQITAYNKNLEQISQKERELAAERERLLDKAINKQNEHTNSIKKAENNIEGFTQATREHAKATRENATAQDNMNRSFDNMKDAIKTFLSVSSAVSGLRNVIRNTFEDVKNLDKSFAEIAMVTDYSVGEMWGSYEQYSEMAIKLGQSTQGVIQASGLFYQQGLNTKESLELTEDTMKLATLAGLDFSEATSQMTAALRGFKMEMDEGNRVTDVYSELAAKAAADVQGIAYAMSKTASIAESAGMEFETTSAFLTQMIETTQEAPENIGTAMKTIIARFTELKTNVAGTTESEFDDLDYNKVDTALKSVGVSIKDANGQFKDLDDVFLELSSKWDSLDRNTQRYIATIAAGSRQQSRFIALMDNYERTLELTEVAYNSTGKASEQFAKHQDTLEFKINRLKGEWEKFRLKIADSDFFKGLVDLFGNFVSYVSDLDLSQVATHIIAIVSALKILSGVITRIQTSMQEGGVFSEFSNIKGLGGKIAEGKKKKSKTTKEIEEGGELAGEIIEEKMASSGEQAAEIIAENIRESGHEIAEEIGQAIQNGEEESELSEILGESEDENEQNDNTDEDTKESNEEVKDAVENIGEQMKDAVGEASDRETDAIAEQTIKDAATDTMLTQSDATAEYAEDMGDDSAEASLFTRLFTQLTAILTAIRGNTIADISSGGTNIPVKGANKAAKIGKAAKTGSGAGKLASAASKTAGFIGKALPVIQLGSILTTAGIAIGKSIGDHFKKEESERLKKYEESLETIAEKDNYNMAKTTSTQNNQKTFNEHIEAINTLQDISFRTAAQEEKLTQAIEYMNNNHPELVKSYDENTGKMTLLTSAVEENSKLLDEQTKAQRIADLSKMTSGSQAYTRTTQYWDDKTTGDDNAEWWSEHTAENTGALTATGSIIGAATAPLWAGTMATAIATTVGASVGSVVPVVGTIIGGAIGLGVGTLIGWATGAVSDTNDTIEETYADFEKLDLDTQNKVLEKLQENNNELKSVTDIEDWLSEDEANQTELIDTVQAIYEEIRKEAHWNETEAAVEANIASMEFTDAYGEKVDLDQSIVAGAVTESEINDLAEITEQLDEKDTAMTLGKNESLDDVSDAWSEVAFTRNGVNTNALEVFKEMRDILAGLRDADNGYTLPSWEDLKPEEQASLGQYGITGDLYSQLQQKDLSDLYDKGIGDADDLYKLVNFYKDNVLEGLIIEGNEVNQEEYEKLQEYASHRNYEDWEKRRAEALSGTMTREEAKKAIEAIQQEMRTAGLDEGIIDSIFGLDENGEAIEGSFAQIEQKWTEMANTLKSKDVGFDSIVIDSLTGEGIGNLHNLMTNVLTDADGAIKASLVNLYNNALKNIQSSDIDATAKSKVSAYISNIFTPENFDPALMGQYINELVGFGMEVEEASKMVDDFYENFKRNDLLNLATDLEDVEGNFEKTEQSISSVTDAWEIFVDNIDSWSADGITSELLKTVAASKELAGAFNLSNFSFDMGAGELASRMYSATMGAAQGLFDKAEVAEDKVTANQYKIEALSYIMQAIEMEQNLRDQVEDLKDAEEDAKEASEKADKALEDANRAIEEAEKQVYETHHGSDLYMPSVGAEYNYDSQLERTEKALDRINTKLEDATELQEKIKLLNDEVATEQEASVLRLAKMQTLQGAIADSNAWLAENASQYISQMEDGSYVLSDALFNNPDIPDAYAEEIIRKTEEVNQWIATIEDLSDQEEEAERARLERQKQRRDDYVSFLEEGADILKEQAEKEVAALEEKYQALEDADNNYLDALEDAINKQRELREQEKQYSDLATKEKKLALMSRDTSGANQKEVQNLQKEVEDERNSLLDNEVDNLIDNMRTLAEEQAELRNTEIELKNAIIEETSYTKQFAEIASTWTSPEDANAFYLENTDTENMTTEQIEAAMQSFADAYQAGSLYLISNQDEVNSYTEATAQMIEDKITEMGDFWTAESTATTEQVKLDVQDAKNEANAAYVEAINNANDASEEAKELKEDWNDAKDASATAEANMKTSIEAINKTAQVEWEKTSGAMAQATIQALRTVMSDEAIMDYLGIEKEEFEAALNGTLRETVYGPTREDIVPVPKTKTYSPEDKLKDLKNTPEKTDLYRIWDEATQTWKYTSDTSIVIPYANDKNQKVQKQNVSAVGARVHELSNDKYWDNYERNDTLTGPDFDSVVSKTTGGYMIEKNGIKKIVDEDTYNRFKGVSGVSGYELQRLAAGTSWAKKYKTGGLVNYTGPAWVDGTPSKPEAFLSAQDTERIGNAAKLLADLPILNSTSNANNAVSSNIGDTSIEIHINVESLASDYDVDQMIERVKNDILDVSKPTGTSVILHK